MKYPPFSFSSRPHVLSQLFQFSGRSGHVVLLQRWVYAPYMFITFICFLVKSETYLNVLVLVYTVHPKWLKCLSSPVESKVSGGSRVVGLAALGLSRQVREVLIWYTEERSTK